VSGATPSAPGGLYSDVIRDRWRKPRHRGDLPGANAVAEDVNPLCGDRVRIMLSVAPEGLPVLGRARRYVRRANIPNPRRMYSYDAVLAAPLTDLLTDDFFAAVSPEEMLATAEAHFRRPAAGTSELNRLLYLDLKLAIADNDVRKVTGMTDLAGVAVRYPLLDARLAEFSGRIPSVLKLRGLQKRFVFKQALADFLPPEVLTKTKHGFGAPIAVWMRSDPAWREFIGDLLHDTRTRQRGYLKPAVFDQFWKDLHSDGASFYGDSLWPWVMLELWHRRHLDGNQSDTEKRHRSQWSAGVRAGV